MTSTEQPTLPPGHLPTSVCFNGSVQLHNHSHIQTAAHASLFKTGELCLPGYAPEIVAVQFLAFQFNAVQGRNDAVFKVTRDQKFAGTFFVSAFRSLYL